ncbi:hypothetical protein [Sporosarcina sp. ITBMC105]
MNLSDIDKEKLAQKVLLAPLVSFKGKHQWPRSTFESYVYPDEDDVEGHFVKDLLTLNTPSMIEKWFGGEEEAAAILLNLKEQEKQQEE